MNRILQKILNKLTAYPRFLLWTISSLLILILLSQIGFYFGVRNPEFCASCHYEKPYYEQWKNSTHSEVSCYSCHPMSQGNLLLTSIKYFTGNYQMRPRAEVHDRSCLDSDCHAEMDIDEEVTFKESVKFSHKKHLNGSLRGNKLHCTSCHSQLVQGEHIAVTEQTCYLCHFRGAKEGQAVTGCPTCHGIPSKINVKYCKTDSNQ